MGTSIPRGARRHPISVVNAVRLSRFSFPTFPHRTRKDGAPIGLARVGLSRLSSWRETSLSRGLKPLIFFRFLARLKSRPFKSIYPSPLSISGCTRLDARAYIGSRRRKHQVPRLRHRIRFANPMAALGTTDCFVAGLTRCPRILFDCVCLVILYIYVAYLVDTSGRGFRLSFLCS